ncbi:MAG: hypothetical protein MJ211_05090 [Bacteroidales bacterium]|nr:hypothetical protein [Bacteroidales bacterium]
MKTLELKEMVTVEGGDWGCAFAIAGFACSEVGLIAFSGGIGAAIGTAACFWASAYGVFDSCA